MLGLRKIPQEQRWIIEWFGKYSKTLRPGLHWIWPVIEKVRTFVSVWEQRYPLFEKEVKIDFLDGSATPKGAFVFVQCNEEKDPDAPYKMVYEVKNVEEATVSLVENTVRSYWNTKAVDQALQAGHNIRTGMPRKDKNAMAGQLRNWGLKLCRITVDDFDLDKIIIEAREAKHKKKTRAEETMGALIQMIAEAWGVEPVDVQREININPNLKEQFLKITEDLIHRRMAIDGKSFLDIRVAGAEGMEKALLDLIAVWRKLPGKEGKIAIGKKEGD